MATLVKVKLEAHLRHYLLLLKIVGPTRIFNVGTDFRDKIFCMVYKYRRVLYVIHGKVISNLSFMMLGRET
jgi:hypothetical protein